MTTHANTIRSIAERANQESHAKEIERVDNLINKAALEGRYGIFIALSDTWIVRHYQSEGYKVNTTIREDHTFWLTWGD